jgi:hypothetical protein
MTIRSITQLLAQADSTIEDNVTGLIGAADVRNMIKDFLDTISPAYGVISLTSQVLSLTTTPLVISPFLTSLEATAGYYTNNLAAGQTTRLINGVVAGATDFIIASGGVAGGNNNNVLVELWKNGVATGLKTSVTCAGASDAQGFNLAGLSYTATVDAVYELRANAPAGSYTFTNVTLVVQAQPVRNF